MLINGIDYIKRSADLSAAGVDPDGLDTEFGTPYVYCSSHVGVHETGSCTVPNMDKFPLVGPTIAEAADQARTAGHFLLSDDHPCMHCGAMTHSRVGFAKTDHDGNAMCEPGNPKSQAHAWSSRR